MAQECTLTPIANWREIYDGYPADCYRPPADVVQEHNLTPRQVRAWTQARGEEFNAAMTELLARYGCTRIDTVIYRDELKTAKPNGEPVDNWDLQAVRNAVLAINYERADRAYSDPSDRHYIGPSNHPSIDEPTGFLSTVMWHEDGKPITATRITTNTTAGPRWLIGVRVRGTWYNDGVYEWHIITGRDALANPGESTLKIIRGSITEGELL